MFETESINSGGRIAKLDVSGKTIRTPLYSPTTTSIVQAGRSDRVDKSDFQPDVGIHIEWFSNDNLKELMTGSDELNARIDKAKESLRLLKAHFKVLHMEFFGDVVSISDKKLGKLMEFQLSTEANLMEIPNNYDSTITYGHTIDAVIDWLKKNDRTDIPLLGTALDSKDVGAIEKRKDKLFAVGLNQRRENVPLLVELQRTFMKEDLFTLSFMLPRAYSEVGRQGTMGPLVNFFGLDAHSLGITNPSSRWGFAKYYFGKMTEEEKRKLAEKSKYFESGEYSTPTISTLGFTHGGDKELSDFCPCKVCDSFTIDDYIRDYQNALSNNRAHEFFSYTGESGEFRKKIGDGESVDYVKKKTFPRRIAGL